MPCGITDSGGRCREHHLVAVGGLLAAQALGQLQSKDSDDAGKDAEHGHIEGVGEILRACPHPAKALHETGLVRDRVEDT